MCTYLLFLFVIMSLTEANLEKKLQSATNSQDSIQTLSLWLLHHRAHHQKIVAAWMKVLKKAKITHRLTLFYLANDVIQNSKRKGISVFKESFADVLREATLLVRDEQIRNSVNRVFKIWGERNVYESSFIDDLEGILVNAKVPANAPSKLLAEFKCEKVIEKVRSVSKLQTETTTKMATLNISKLDATNAEIVQKLKDRSHGQQFSSEFDESSRCLEDIVKSLTKEVQERNELILLLEQSEIYYDTQRGEAKIVANAYKNFGCRVKALQKKLEELTQTFPPPSPVPSPCPDAPSPTTSDLEAELELPSEGAGKMTSWLDTFPVKTPDVSDVQGSKSGSLDSRLSSLLQKIPNLPGNLQDTLFNTSGISDSTRKSPVQSGAKVANSFSTSDSTTPIKDECSGQNTPLQDEDISVSSSASSFFSRLAAAPKTSQNPKDILKGLTTLIQTASSKEKSFKHETWPSESEPHINKVSSFFNKIIPNQSSLTLSPPPFFSSPGLSSESRKNENNNMSASQTPALPLHSHLSSQPVVATNIHENLSFIPTLVPSTPTGGHFNFKTENDLDEYDPSAENLNMDIDPESGEESGNTPGSVACSESTPDKESQEEILENLSATRQSTLITLIANTPNQGVLNPKVDLDMKSNSFHANESYSAIPAMGQGDAWSSVPATLISQADHSKEINESSVITSTGKPFFPATTASDQISFPNGKEQEFPMDRPLSKIETVQSSRLPNDNKWGRSDWAEFDKDYRQSFDSRSRQNQGFQGYPAYQQKNYQQNFETQQYGWNRDRQHAGQNMGQPRKWFPPGPVRGRGWKRYPHPY